MTGLTPVPLAWKIWIPALSLMVNVADSAEATVGINVIAIWQLAFTASAAVLFGHVVLETAKALTVLPEKLALAK